MDVVVTNEARLSGPGALHLSLGPDLKAALLRAAAERTIAQGRRVTASAVARELLVAGLHSSPRRIA